MTAAASHHPEPVAPPAEPKAIRACLTEDVAAVFDHEWDFVMELAKREKSLNPVHELLDKWRHFAYGELVEPGRYFRVLATAARTLATGKAPEGSRPMTSADIQALAERRQAGR